MLAAERGACTQDCPAHRAACGVAPRVQRLLRANLLMPQSQFLPQLVEALMVIPWVVLNELDKLKHRCVHPRGGSPKELMRVPTVRRVKAVESCAQTACGR